MRRWRVNSPLERQQGRCARGNRNIALFASRRGEPGTFDRRRHGQIACYLGLLQLVRQSQRVRRIYNARGLGRGLTLHGR